MGHDILELFLLPANIWLSQIQNTKKTADYVDDVEDDFHEMSAGWIGEWVGEWVDERTADYIMQGLEKRSWKSDTHVRMFYQL